MRWRQSIYKDSGLKRLKNDAFSPLYEVESDLCGVLAAIWVTGNQGNDAIDMEGNEGLSAFFAEEEGAVGGVVVEEVFGEDVAGRVAVGEWAFGAVEFFC